MRFPSLTDLSLLAAFVLLLSLQGCTSRTTVVPNDVQFNANSPDSIVVLGTSLVTKEPDFVYVKSYYVGFSHYAPDTYLITGSFSDRKEYYDVITCLKYFKSGYFCNDTSWHVFRVPAGHHAFMTVAAHPSTGPTRSTVFTEREFHSLGRGVITGDRIYAFQTEPGKIYYLGNYVFDLMAFPARIVRYYVDMDGARNKLKEFKNISGAINHITVKRIPK